MSITPWQKEWNALIKQERSFLKKGNERKISMINKALAGKVPEALEHTLNAAFAKAFDMVFRKGTWLIEKTYRKEDAELQYKVNTYAAELRESRKTLGKFSKAADNSSAKNLVITGVEGIGLGALGVGLPDIPVFVGVILKSIYEISLHYGYPYDTIQEKYFILQIIETALSHGEQLTKKNQWLNQYLDTEIFPENYDEQQQISQAAAVLSTELLNIKFLQGLPIVGLIGGVYNTVYLQKILCYAKLKYQRRFLLDRADNSGPDIA